MTKSIAVLSFLPDAGHVLPLLRLAAVFRARGYEVECYLPQECARYTEGYDFRFVSLGTAISTAIEPYYRRMLAKLSRKSIFYNAFSVYLDLSISYLDPLVFGVTRLLPLVRNGLADQQPLFIISDDHVFRPLYIELSGDLGIPLVVHSSEGYRAYQSKYVQFYGIRDSSRAVQAPIECIGAASEFVCRLIRRMRKETNQERMHSQAARALRSSRCNSTQTIVVATGYNGYLERCYLGSKLHISDDLHVFGPLCRIKPRQLATDVRDWIERDQNAVVYVSFGSMIELGSQFVQAVLDGLRDLDVRTLWSMPQRQQDSLLPSLAIPGSVYFKDFVDPLGVLSMANVRCGINHGGAGSIQDCLISGKPMLCIPFMWDQPFNSSVVQHLQAGIALPKRRVCAKAIAASIGSILTDQRMTLHAGEIADTLQNCNQEAAVFDFILSQPTIKNREQ